jgi:hypothetical protein
MDYVVNLHGEGQVMLLEAKRYTVDVLGGWGVKLQDFSLRFKNIDNGEVVVCRKATWPVQRYRFNKRSKRTLAFEIRNAGSYLIEIENPASLNVKYSNLFFRSMFESPVPNSKIQLYIH